MAFYTNYASSPLDGVLLPAGHERQVVLRQILDAILSVTGGNWLEVTSSSPTPANLQAFATSVPAGVTNANSSPSTSDQITIYNANDPELANGHSRLFRLQMINTGSTTSPYEPQIMDTRTQQSVWANIGNGLDGLYSDSSALFSSTSSTGQSNYDSRLLVFGDTDWLIVVIFQPTRGVNVGAIGIWMPPSVAGFPRTVLPWAFTLTMNNNSTSQHFLRFPASTLDGGGGQGSIISHHANASSMTQSNQVPFGLLDVVRTNGYYSHMMQLPRIRTMPAQYIPLWHSFTLASTTWVCFAKTQQVAYCIDISS
ncbi:MAG: hypothetical protein KatS3mg051_1587 [Anaerolineae bacterium]|nr:MAG: hypothetical protein KatS3mg051_1587 [Anaerolineae bacterium]